MCPAAKKPTLDPPRVGLSEGFGTGKEIRLPKVLRRLVDGLRGGVGITSQPSLSIVGGARPDLVPIVVCVSRGTGLTSFLTSLATLYALKEEGTGDVILMHSYSLDAAALRSLLETSRKAGNSDEITFEISMRAPGPDGTFQSI